MKAATTAGFLRSVYGSFMIKLLLVAFVVLGYAFLYKENINNTAFHFSSVHHSLVCNRLSNRVGLWSSLRLSVDNTEPCIRVQQHIRTIYCCHQHIFVQILPYIPIPIRTFESFNVLAGAGHEGSLYIYHIYGAPSCPACLSSSAIYMVQSHVCCGLNYSSNSIIMKIFVSKAKSQIYVF